MDLSKLNGSSFEKVFDDVENIKDYGFIKPCDSGDTIYTVRGCYLNKGTYGFQTVFILENPKARINFTGRELFDSIITDKEIIGCIKTSKLTMKVQKYFNEKYKKDCYKPFFEQIPF